MTMRPAAPETALEPKGPVAPNRPLEPFQVLVAIVAILSVAAGLTFLTVHDPGTLRLARFHAPSVVTGASLILLAFLYKRFLSPSPEGFPSYFTYLVLASIVPSAGFFRTVHRFINWRAFGFTFFFILLVSLLWEATLALPYGWWGYEPRAMMGLTIGAWSGLPIEAVLVWFAVTFTTVIVYEVIKIWQALGVRAKQAFFGGPA